MVSIHATIAIIVGRLPAMAALDRREELIDIISTDLINMCIIVFVISCICIMCIIMCTII